MLLSFRRILTTRYYQNSGSSYKTELGATWRSLLPSTQRSYIIVAVKKIERQAGKTPPSKNIGAAEACAFLQNAVYELLVCSRSRSLCGTASLTYLLIQWITPPPTPSQRHTKKCPRHLKSISGNVLSGATALGRTVQVAIPKSTAAVLPLSAVWYSPTSEKGSHTLKSLPLHSAIHKLRRKPTSPLALYAYGTKDGDEVVSLLVEGCSLS